MKQSVKIACLLLAVSATVAAAYSWNASRPLPFDRVLWLQGDTDRSMHPSRHRMADGLVKSEVLLGKTRTEIEAMLGPPPTTDYFKSFDLVYWLGPERGYIRIDSEWLVVRLSDGKASEVRIVRD